MKRYVFVVLAFVAISLIAGCGPAQTVQSVSGTKMAGSGAIQKNANGLTVEQQNISDRIQMDNRPGSIKHLYIISPYSGQVLIYSTVKGKVTSSKKRLTPNRIVGTADSTYGFAFDVNGLTYYTDEILGEDGTVGESEPYIYWWDARGIYHQHFVTDGQIIHVSNQPQAVKGVIINMEISQKK
ncbi:MAG: hypothetical protein US49_C0018G0003 [candidate division TM6 bacterium GW2011_GWF2_37_49]|nr:MAG: hypothetical protein US49_C0018G0003 [candidate division TM6 bacterium GW2011_GWF2_37_49]